MDEALLLMLGYDTSKGELTKVHTGNGTKQVRTLKIAQIDSLGLERRNFAISASSFPPWYGFEGILGLSFMRKTKLTIDFFDGQIGIVDR